MWGDIGLIERVLENLIENALRYTPSGGTVTLALSQQEHQVLVRITDTGCGIPEQDLPYIFDRFYRVGRHQRSEGAGLGLAITKRILELHGSWVEVDSSVKVGTTIAFCLSTSS